METFKTNQPNEAKKYFQNKLEFTLEGGFESYKEQEYEIEKGLH